MPRHTVDAVGLGGKVGGVKAPSQSLFSLVLCFLITAVTAFADASLYDIPLKDIDGQATSLAPYRGKVLLIVNVASKCGNTPQYEQLEALYEKHKSDGFEVLGFPCNQFGQQEPGSNEQIKEFCSSTYSVTFPLFDKLDVNGEHRHPLYTALAGEKSPFPGNIGWNFEKFLVGRDGKILHRFAPRTKPDAPEVVAAIDEALAAK
jgi:glutathione peroxidase